MLFFCLYVFFFSHFLNISFDVRAREFVGNIPSYFQATSDYEHGAK